jgi:hypothetical protein
LVQKFEDENLSEKFSVEMDICKIEPRFVCVKLGDFFVLRKFNDLKIRIGLAT